MASNTPKPGMDQRVRLLEMANGLDAVIAFAESVEDYVLAAKSEDVRIMILDRLSTCSRP